MALTDPAGGLQTQYTYEPFGATSATGPASSSPFQYTGRENDGTGLYYYRARYYHPELTRFISEDPIRLHGAETNFFVYVANNPVNFIDPFGLDKEKKCEDLFPPGLEWLKYYLTAEKTLTPFVVGNASILAGSAVAAGGIVATGGLIAAAPETLGLSLIAVPGTLLVVAAGEYLVVFGTDVNIGQVNTLLGTKIPRPHDVAPKAFPGLPSGKLCR